MLLLFQLLILSYPTVVGEIKGSSPSHHCQQDLHSTRESLYLSPWDLMGSYFYREGNAHWAKMPKTIGYQTEFSQHPIYYKVK